MVVFPNAKINIGLYITQKRPDGYHNLETAFFPIPWTDILEITPSEKFSFTSTGLPISGNLSDNLCVKAYQLLKNQFDIPPVDIHLHKIIPMGAGLGGGSADASYTLIALRDLFKLPLTNQELIPFAQQLGSDCAFFLQNSPQFGTGKGDELQAIEARLSGLWALLIFPNLGVSTQQAYSGVKPGKAPNYLPIALNLPIESWKNAISNDFEKTIFPLFPELVHIKETLYEIGAVYAAMSGSGSTMFGLFTQEPKDEIFKNQSFTTKIVQF